MSAEHGHNLQSSLAKTRTSPNYVHGLMKRLFRISLYTKMATCKFSPAPTWVVENNGDSGINQCHIVRDYGISEKCKISWFAMNLSKIKVCSRLIFSSSAICFFALIFNTSMQGDLAPSYFSNRF